MRAPYAAGPGAIDGWAPRRATAAVLAVSAMLLLSAEAQAAAARFVASNGNDASACTRAAPCRTLPRGVRVTPIGAELQILDSGLYGDPLTIRKSITISARGVSATLGNVVIDNAGAVVTLQGLLFNGKNSGAEGIFITAAAAVHIEDCEIERFTGNGILLDGADTELFVTNSVSRDNGIDGLRIFGDGTSARLTVDNSRFENNAIAGLYAQGIQSTITRSLASGNAFHGIVVIDGSMNVTWTTAADNGYDGYASALTGDMTLESSVARGNGGSGLRAAGGPTPSRARISNSVFTNNATGIHVETGAEVLTRKNNTVSGNGSGPANDVVGTLTPLPPR